MVSGGQETLDIGLPHGASGYACVSPLLSPPVSPKKRFPIDKWPRAFYVSRVDAR